MVKQKRLSIGQRLKLATWLEAKRGEIEAGKHKVIDLSAAAGKVFDFDVSERVIRAVCDEIEIKRPVAKRETKQKISGYLHQLHSRLSRIERELGIQPSEININSIGSL